MDVVMLVCGLVFCLGCLGLSGGIIGARLVLDPDYKIVCSGAFLCLGILNLILAVLAMWALLN